MGAFDELVRRTEARVRGAALAVLRNRSEAEEAAQEAFLRAFRHRVGFRGEAPVGAWLCRIAVRCAHDLLRRAAREERVRRAAATEGADDGFSDARGNRPGDRFGDDGDRGEPRSGDEAERLRTRLELDAAIRRLPADESESLVLKEVAGMTYVEIARLIGAPLGTVQSRIHRARRRLRDVLAAVRNEAGGSAE